MSGDQKTTRDPMTICNEVRSCFHLMSLYEAALLLKEKDYMGSVL